MRLMVGEAITPLAKVCAENLANGRCYRLLVAIKCSVGAIKCSVGDANGAFYDDIGAFYEWYRIFA